MNMWPASIEEAAAALRAGTITSTGLVEAALARADHHDDRLGVYLARIDEAARAAARRADDELARGIDRGPLQGIPLGIKDLFATDDAPTTAQSLALDPTWGDRGDGAAMRRLRAKGAVIMGKTTTMELAHGLPDPDMAFPVPANPWNPRHWAGGSSSGTASGTAAGFFLGGIGSDTGGSIRAPAAYCGITGLKPTYGRVPKDGCVENSFSMDHVGPLARTARDCAAILEAIAGPDPADPTAAARPVPAYTTALDGSIEGLRIAVERVGHADRDGVHPAVRARYEDAIELLERHGARVVEVELAHLATVANAHSIVSMAEKFACHRRGLARHWERFGRHTRLMSAQGALVDAADYIAAQRVRTWALRAYRQVLGDHDVLAVPTMAGVAPELGGLTFESLFATHISFTGTWALLGLPAIAVPMGLAEEGLPVSLQLIAAPFEESTVLRAADAYQRLTDWHLRWPPGFAPPGASPDP